MAKVSTTALDTLGGALVKEHAGEMLKKHVEYFRGDLGHGSSLRRGLQLPRVRYRCTPRRGREENSPPSAAGSGVRRARVGARDLEADVVDVAPVPVLAGLERLDDRVRVAWKCAVACLPGELSQQPMWPHEVHRRRCTQGMPSSRHSTQPLPLGSTGGSHRGACRCSCVHYAVAWQTSGRRPTRSRAAGRVIVVGAGLAGLTAALGCATRVGRRRARSAHAGRRPRAHVVRRGRRRAARPRAARRGRRRVDRRNATPDPAPVAPVRPGDRAPAGQHHGPGRTGRVPLPGPHVHVRRAARLPGRRGARRLPAGSTTSSSSSPTKHGSIPSTPKRPTARPSSIA